MLIKEYPLMIYPETAKKIGLNEAIVFQQLHYWLEKSGKVKEKRKWIYNTYNEWQKQFPFWSVKTIIRTIKSLEKQGLITIGNFNKMRIDKTSWYTINYDKIPSNPVNTPLGQNVHMDEDNLSTPITRDYTLVPSVNLISAGKIGKKEKLIPHNAEQYNKLMSMMSSAIPCR